MSNYTDNFAWGKIIEVFNYDFDGILFEVVKYHPFTLNGSAYTLLPNKDEVRYTSEGLDIFKSIDALLIAWIAKKNLGMNQHSLVYGVCRALEANW